MYCSITGINALMEAPRDYSSYLLWETTVGWGWGKAGRLLQKNFIEYYKINLGLEIWVMFFQINKGGKQGKKFIGYKKNVYEGKQDAVKE